MLNSNTLKNQKKFMMYLSFFPEQSFINAILVLFYLYHLNINMSDYLILDSVLFLLTAILEIPSGFISDYFGRKRMLLISQILMIISMVILLYSTGFYLGLVSIIFLSFGLSLGSSNDVSILYEFFSENDTVENYEKLLANKNTIFFISTAIYSIISGFIFKINMDLIIIFDIVIMILNIIITYIYLYDKYPRGVKQVKRNKNNTFKFKILNKVLLTFILMSLLFSFFRVTFNFYQPMYEEIHIPIELLGFFPLIYNVLASIGSQIYGKILTKVTDKIKSLIIVFFLLFSVIILLVSNIYYLVLFVIFFQQIIRGIFFSYNTIAINNEIPKDTNYRTMYISFYRMLLTLLGAILIFISSIISGHFNLFFSYIATSLLILLFAILTLLFYKKNSR